MLVEFFIPIKTSEIPNKVLSDEEKDDLLCSWCSANSLKECFIELDDYPQFSEFPHSVLKIIVDYDDEKIKQMIRSLDGCRSNDYLSEIKSWTISEIIPYLPKEKR